MFRDLGQQVIEQRNIAAGIYSKVQISLITTGRAPGINHNDLCATLGARVDQALVQNRVAPRQVRSNKNNQISVIKVIICARNRVCSKGAFVARNRRGHAQAGIGVDIGGTDEPFHQLVGDIVVFCQHLT